MRDSTAFGTGAPDEIRRHRYIFVIACIFALSATSCVEPRLADPGEFDETEEIGFEDPFEGWDHLHEDGNWYAGWSRSLSPELTDEAVISEDETTIQFPRSPANDAGLEGISSMDIIVGASPNTGFLKRVLTIEKGEEFWTLEVLDAGFHEVFLEGDFNFSRDNPQPTLGSRPYPKVMLEEAGLTPEDLGQTETTENALTTHRQSLDLKADVFKRDAEVLCTSSRDCQKARDGVSISATPGVNFLQPIDGRMVFQASSEFSKSRDMCEDLSSAEESFELYRQRREAWIRNGASFNEEQEQRLAAIALQKQMEWALKWAGHTPFRPFVPQWGTRTEAEVQRFFGGTHCDEDQMFFAEQYEADSGHNEDCRWERDGGFFDITEPNRYFVRRTSGVNYRIFDDPGSFNGWNPRNWFDPAFWAAGDTRRNSKVYYAMRPDFQQATAFMDAKISEEPRIAQVYASSWGFSTDIEWSTTTVGLSNHYNNQYVTRHIAQRGQTTPEDILEPYVTASRLVGSSDFRDQVAALRNQPLVEDLKWLESAVAVGKMYCQGLPDQDFVIGFGAKALFEWEPKITIEYTREFGGDNDPNTLRRGSIPETPALEIPFVNVPSWFAVGPIPVHAEWELSFLTKATLTFRGQAEIKFRKYLADIDFFWGIRRGRDGEISPTTPQDYAEITGRDVNTDAVAAENRMRFFERPRLDPDLETPNDRITPGAENFLRQEPFVTLGGFEAGAKGQFFAGLNGAVLFYRTFGPGVNVGAGGEVGVTVDLSGQNVKAEGNIGAQVELEGSLRIPFCGENCMDRILGGFCRIPYLGNFLCSSEVKTSALGFPIEAKLNNQGREAKLTIPVLKSCQFFGEDLVSPSCSAGTPFDFDYTWLPPCFKFCAEASAPAGNKWIAIKALDYQPDPDHPAGIQGIPIDAVVINRNGQLIQPISARTRLNDINGIDSDKLVYCGESSCPGPNLNFETCNFDIMHDRVVDVENMLFVEFEEIKAGDDLFIIRQNMPPSASPEGYRCSAENGRLEIYTGAMDDYGFWRQVDTMGVNETSAGIELGLTNLARPGDPTSDVLIR